MLEILKDFRLVLWANLRYFALNRSIVTGNDMEEVDKKFNDIRMKIVDDIPEDPDDFNFVLRREALEYYTSIPESGKLLKKFTFYLLVYDLLLWVVLIFWNPYSILVMLIPTLFVCAMIYRMLTYDFRSDKKAVIID